MEAEILKLLDNEPDHDEVACIIVHNSSDIQESEAHLLRLLDEPDEDEASIPSSSDPDDTVTTAPTSQPQTLLQADTPNHHHLLDAREYPRRNAQEIENHIALDHQSDDQEQEQEKFLPWFDDCSVEELDQFFPAADLQLVDLQLQDRLLQAFCEEALTGCP